MVIIVDYDMGNVASVKNALDALGAESKISRESKDFDRATHIILPGVGTFSDGMNKLAERGLIKTLEGQVLKNKKAFLGICLGMQLLAEVGEEGGLHKGLGWVKGKTRKLSVSKKHFRLPHIGWNDVYPADNSLLFENVKPSVFYFIHSYCLAPDESGVVTATCEYGEEFTASVAVDNLFGVQFHPERSQKSGLRILENFLNFKDA
ncbi:MAG: imidazole glycerol phosphate synthase subunit HisH [Candidatus Curtissbacteria bacterium]|nr:imidazole glycerol phosphate synthase subunit HisH [Candidatus Curtissbacteria bacterium]